MELRPIPGIQNPLPTGARPQPSAQVAAASATTAPAMPALTRPRSLSAEATRVIRSIAKTMKEAPPLAVTTQKVAEAAIRDGRDEGGRH
jgi:penicillin-binding protein 1A